MRKKRYFCEEDVFGFIWQHCDNDGIWDGDATTIAAKFDVSEDAAHSALSDLTDRGLIEKLYPATYAITNWRERDDPLEEE